MATSSVAAGLEISDEVVDATKLIQSILNEITHSKQTNESLAHRNLGECQESKGIIALIYRKTKRRQY